VFAMKMNTDITMLIWDLEQLRNGSNVHVVSNLLHRLKSIDMLSKRDACKVVRKARLVIAKLRGGMR